MYCEEKFVVQAIKYGASGYLTTTGSPWELVMAMKSVMADKKYFGTNVIESLFLNLENENHRTLPHELLTPRELQMLWISLFPCSAG
jgi:DNA-binding NarL/FixJ family response regulator